MPSSSSKRNAKKELYEFDGSYLKELNTIRKQLNLVEIKEDESNEKSVDIPGDSGSISSPESRDKQELYSFNTDYLKELNSIRKKLNLKEIEDDASNAVKTSKVEKSRRVSFHEKMVVDISSKNISSSSKKKEKNNLNRKGSKTEIKREDTNEFFQLAYTPPKKKICVREESPVSFVRETRIDEEISDNIITRQNISKISSSESGKSPRTCVNEYQSKLVSDSILYSEDKEKAEVTQKNIEEAEMFPKIKHESDMSSQGKEKSVISSRIKENSGVSPKTKAKIELTSTATEKVEITQRSNKETKVTSKTNKKADVILTVDQKTSFSKAKEKVEVSPRTKSKTEPTPRFKENLEIIQRTNEEAEVITKTNEKIDVIPTVDEKTTLSSKTKAKSAPTSRVKEKVEIIQRTIETAEVTTKTNEKTDVILTTDKKRSSKHKEKTVVSPRTKAKIEATSRIKEKIAINQGTNEEAEVTTRTNKTADTTPATNEKASPRTKAKIEPNPRSEEKTESIRKTKGKSEIEVHLPSTSKSKEMATVSSTCSFKVKKHKKKAKKPNQKSFKNEPHHSAPTQSIIIPGTYGINVGSLIKNTSPVSSPSERSSPVKDLAYRKLSLKFPANITKEEFYVKAPQLLNVAASDNFYKFCSLNVPSHFYDQQRPVVKPKLTILSNEEAVKSDQMPLIQEVDSNEPEELLTIFDRRESLDEDKVSLMASSLDLPRKSRESYEFPSIVNINKWPEAFRSHPNTDDIYLNISEARRARRKFIQWARDVPEEERKGQILIGRVRMSASRESLVIGEKSMLMERSEEIETTSGLRVMAHRHEKQALDMQFYNVETIGDSVEVKEKEEESVDEEEEIRERCACFKLCFGRKKQKFFS